MLDTLQVVEDKFEQLSKELLEIGNDYKRAGDINKELVSLEPLIKKSARVPSGDEKFRRSQNNSHVRK
ncbi:MAG: hypothetical protein HC797_08940 [Anaerolineales bacterium]|nr:hypothetical protein [Anaerolineales bacterium]